jgi:hypothetical protein
MSAVGPPAPPSVNDVMASVFWYRHWRVPAWPLPDRRSTLRCGAVMAKLDDIQLEELAMVKLQSPPVAMFSWS